MIHSVRRLTSACSLRRYLLFSHGSLLIAPLPTVHRFFVSTRLQTGVNRQSERDPPFTSHDALCGPPPLTHSPSSLPCLHRTSLIFGVCLGCSAQLCHLPNSGTPIHVCPELWGLKIVGPEVDHANICTAYFAE